ncbi:SGNH/GDSL hydrolase family protein [Sphingomonas sp. RS2018]
MRGWTAVLAGFALLGVAGTVDAQTRAPATGWVRSWAASPHGTLVAQPNRPIPELADRTVRQVVRLSAGGTRLRVRLTNEASDAPLKIGSVTVAIAGANGAILPGSVRRVTFSGASGGVVPAHAPWISDAVAMRVAPLQRIAISIHLPQGATAPTTHGSAYATAWIAPGDQTGATTLTDTVRFGQRLAIAAVDVEGARAAHTVVAYGDSITDGSRATVDADTRYPDQLAARLQAARMTGVAVANAGIGGNRLLEDGTGPNALARFDRDVLAVPGVSHVLVLEGVNDIGSATRAKQPLPTPTDLIAAYRQMIARAHDRGVKVILATILPYRGAGYWSAEGEVVRVAVNDWIRTQREADGVADFDRAIRDPAAPDRMDRRFDGGDALHPNDAGFTAMAAAVDLRLLR